MTDDRLMDTDGTANSDMTWREFYEIQDNVGGDESKVLVGHVTSNGKRYRRYRMPAAEATGDYIYIWEPVNK